MLKEKCWHFSDYLDLLRNFKSLRADDRWNHLKQWNKIVGVVIANGYIDGVAKELVKLGVIPIKYRYKNNLLRLRKCRKEE